jgi:hypothetical protein
MKGDCERRHGRLQRGSMSIELVVLTPVVVMFVLLALGLGRFELAREQVIGAARAGAEAAAVAQSAGEAQSAASTAATPALASGSSSCQDVHVVTNTAAFKAGGRVQVEVTCEVDFSDLLVPGWPGHASVEAVVSAPIDPFRSVQ